MKKISVKVCVNRKFWVFEYVKICVLIVDICYVIVDMIKSGCNNIDESRLYFVEVNDSLTSN